MDIQSLRSVLRLQKHFSLIYVINVILNVLCCVVLCGLPSQSNVLCQLSIYHLSCSQSCFPSLNTLFVFCTFVNRNSQVCVGELVIHYLVDFTFSFTKHMCFRVKSFICSFLAKLLSARGSVPLAPFKA